MKEEKILATTIYEFRKNLGLTQEILAAKLGITPQSISRWENGQSRPDVDMLPKLASIFGVTIDGLFGYHAENLKINHYKENQKKCQLWYKKGKIIKMAREILTFMQPDKPINILEIGCGDGQEAVFFARNGYIVSAFDIDEEKIAGAKKLAENVGVDVNFFCADILTYKIESEFDVVYLSGTMHLIPVNSRKKIVEMIQAGTAVGGLNAVNAIVEKSFIDGKLNSPGIFCNSAELFACYGKDWKFEMLEEVFFENEDDAGATQEYCLDTMIARKMK